MGAGVHINKFGLVLQKPVRHRSVFGDGLPLYGEAPVNSSLQMRWRFFKKILRHMPANTINSDKTWKKSYRERARSNGLVVKESCCRQVTLTTGRKYLRCGRLFTGRPTDAHPGNKRADQKSLIKERAQIGDSSS